MAAITIETNFRQDWASYLLRELDRLGCRVDPRRDPEKLAVAFFNALNRRIPPQPRQVLVAREFTCSSEHQSGMELIRGKVERGEDLTPHLSTLIERDSDLDQKHFNDWLLNNWRIYHLHLGTAPDPKNPKFISRTEDLLFARITSETFYILTVMRHGNWACQELIEIVHRNWPDSIRRHRLNGVAGLEPAFSDDDIATLWERVIVGIQTKDGTVYMPLGGGSTTSKIGVEVADRAAYHTHLIGWLERYVRDNASKLAAEAATQGHTLGPHLRFRFVAFMPESAYIIEDNSRVMFCVPLGRCA